MMRQTAAERRYHERFDIEAPIHYTRFTSYPSGRHEATLKNCSEGGICFESDDALLPGQYIRVRLERPADINVCAGALERLRTQAVVRVRWCSKSDPSDPAPYGVGASYC